MRISRSQIVVIHLILIFVITSMYNQSNSLGFIPTDDGRIFNTSNYENFTVIDPIIVNSNAEMDLYALNNNLTGNGTQRFPFIIDSVLINGSNNDFAISLYKLDRYFTIKSSYFLGGLINSIKAKEVANLYLFNNTIDRTQILTRHECCGNEAIYLQMSADITIEQNLIWDTRIGIETHTGLSTFMSHFGNYSILNNTINGGQVGIVIADGVNAAVGYLPNNIKYNFISDTSGFGIYLQAGAHRNIVYGNLILNCYLLVHSANNTISHNQISGGTGIMFDHNAFNNSITNNTLQGFAYAVILLENDPELANNIFKFNNFQSGTTNIDYRGNEFNNIYDKNYYSDHDKTDSNEDGFADSVYSIAGGNITDVNPLADKNLDSYESLNLKFRPYPGYEEASTTTNSFITSTTSTTTLPSTSTDLSTSIPSTTNTEIVTVTIVETLEQSTEIETTDNSTTGPRLVGNSNQFVFVMLSLFAILILKRPDRLQTREYKQK